MTTTTPPPPPPPPEAGEERWYRRWYRLYYEWRAEHGAWGLVATIVAVVLAIFVLLVIASAIFQACTNGDDDAARVPAPTATVTVTPSLDPGTAVTPPGVSPPVVVVPPDTCATPVNLSPGWKVATTIYAAGQLEAARGANTDAAYYIGPALGTDGLNQLLAESSCTLPVFVRVDNDLNSGQGNSWLAMLANRPQVAGVVTSMHFNGGTPASANARVNQIRAALPGVKIYVEVDGWLSGNSADRRRLEAEYGRGADGLFFGYYPFDGSARYGDATRLPAIGQDAVAAFGDGAVGMIQAFGWDSEPANQFGFGNTDEPPAATAADYAQSLVAAGVRHIVITTQGDTAGNFGYIGDIATRIRAG